MFSFFLLLVMSVHVVCDSPLQANVLIEMLKLCFELILSGFRLFEVVKENCFIERFLNISCSCISRFLVEEC